MDQGYASLFYQTPPAMADKTSRRTKRSNVATRSRGARRVSMPFSRGNYLLIIGGLLAVVIGYGIMRAENEVDGFISLYVAPVLILFGYLEILYAIWWRGGTEQETVRSAE